MSNLLHLMLINLILLFYFIKCEAINESLNDINEIFDKKFPEFVDISSQKLLMNPPSKYCKCHHNTVFFKYPKLVRENNKAKNITEVTIQSKEFLVLGQTTNYYILSNILKNNSIQRSQKHINHEPLKDLNLYWRNKPNSSLPRNFTNKYQRYNHMLGWRELTDKSLLYKNYFRLKSKFNDEFDFISETYTSENMQQFKEKNKNYKLSKDNLWLIKPNHLDQGRGIKFFKDVKDIQNGDIVTRYISNPLLINGKKFDLRIYVLVTGHNPLKIYLFNNCFARLATTNYDLDINDLDNVFKHLTNIHIGKKNKERDSKLVMSLKDIKTYLKDTYSLEFSKIWDDVKDMVIKSLISVNKNEIEREKEYPISSNSLFHLYGLDVMIDDNSKSWLIEINDHPAIIDNESKVINYKEVTDIFNIIGIVPYSHITGLAMEGECKYKDALDEAIQQSICEFTRPSGGFERIFPKKENIDYYKTFFEEVSPNNQALWDEIKKSDFNNEKNNKYIKREL
ncbi:TTL-domain-containing protein [Neocallimastix lanati (nom. inval.)]|nr:TTL-domain-containing protein [Neocallimastix sp. JGI-2020a]